MTKTNWAFALLTIGVVSTLYCNQPVPTTIVRPPVPARMRARAPAPAEGGAGILVVSPQGGAAWTMTAGDIESLRRVPAHGDMDGDFDADGRDIQGFVDCLLGTGVNCDRADLDGDGLATMADAPGFLREIGVTPARTMAERMADVEQRVSDLEYRTGGRDTCQEK